MGNVGGRTTAAPLLVLALIASGCLLGLGGPVADAATPATAVLPLTPVRVWDSRPSEPRGTSGLAPGALSAGKRVEIPVRSVPGLASGARAVVLNVTATGVAGRGFVTVWPCGSTFPLASNLNIAPGEDTANQVSVKVDSTGRVCVRSSVRTHLVVDASGFVPAHSPVSLQVPYRVTDTRKSGAPVSAGGVLKVKVGGQRGVPAGAGLALVNLTSTDSAAFGHFTAYPCSSPPPFASALNFVRGEARANAVWVRLDSAGAFCVRSSSTSHVVVDVTGHAPLTAAGVIPVVPHRIVDTRISMGVSGRLAGNVPVAFAVPGLTDPPQSYRGALLLNVTVTSQAGPGHVTVWPCSARQPRSSNLNFAVNRDRANAVLVAPGGDGRVCVMSTVATNLVVDVNGFVNPAGKSFRYAPVPFSPPRPPAPPALVQGMTQNEIAMIHATNAARGVGRTCGSYGYFPAAAPLAANAALANAAQRHSDDMAARNFFSHIGSDGSRFSDRITGAGYSGSTMAENIAAGYESPTAAVAGLIKSESHCRAIMDSRLTQIGVGYAHNPGASFRHYWSQEFGRPK